MSEFPKIVNWDNVFAKSEEFHNTSPTKFTFVENWIDENFYEKLYETFPKISTFTKYERQDKSAYRRWWGTKGDNESIDPNEEDNELSSEWNLFYKYLNSPEFIENFQKFANLDVNRMKDWTFMNMQRGGYQLPHIHNEGPRTLGLIFYFNKNWPDGSSGGTYMSKDDGSQIIFEPYNLDNSCLIYHDGPYAEHGVRKIDRDTERRAVQITLLGWSEKDGWCLSEQPEPIEL